MEKPSKRDWKSRYIQIGANQNIIKFIGNILFHGSFLNSNDDSVKTIANLFSNGYCYYFAKNITRCFSEWNNMSMLSFWTYCLCV